MLLDPLEKQLDLPPRLVQVGNRLPHPRRVVRHEHVAPPRFLVPVADPPQRARIGLAVRALVNSIVWSLEHPGPDVDVVLTHHLIAHVPLQAGHKGHPPLLQLMEPPEIKIRAVGHHHAAGRERPRRATVTSPVLPSVTLMNVGRCPAWSTPTCSLIAPFVRRNDAHGKAARHKSMVDASTANSLFLNRKPCRGARCWQRASRRPKRFVERIRLLCVHPRQRGTTDERSHAQVIELVGLGAQVADESRRLCRPPSCPRPRATNCAQRLTRRSLWPSWCCRASASNSCRGSKSRSCRKTVVLWATAWISCLLNDLEQSLHQCVFCAK